MYEVPILYQCRLYHPRPRFKLNIENVLAYMAFSIAELDGKQVDEFKKGMLEAIVKFPGNKKVSTKTLNNWRTEITTLFSMVSTIDGMSFATDITKELANKTNLKIFFLRILMTFQYPGGFLKSASIKKLLSQKIFFHPLKWLTEFFSLNPNEYITDVEFCHCVLNDLRIVRDHENINLTFNRIIENRKNKVQYNKQGDVKRYALDILDYAVLAGVLIKNYEGKYFLNHQSLNFCNFFKTNTPVFNSYSEKMSLQEIDSIKEKWILFVNEVSSKTLKEYEKANASEINKNKELVMTKLENDIFSGSISEENILTGAMTTKEIGDKGEYLSLAHEKYWLMKNGREDLIHLVKLIPNQFALGYDISSRELDATDKMIEVKTTISEKPFTVHRVHLTPNEWNMAESHRKKYYIYRLQISKNSIKLWIIQDPVGLYKQDKMQMVIRDGADLTFTKDCYQEVELLGLS